MPENMTNTIVCSYMHCFVWYCMQKSDKTNEFVGNVISILQEIFYFNQIHDYKS